MPRSASRRRQITAADGNFVLVDIKVGTVQVFLDAQRDNSFTKQHNSQDYSTCV